METQRLRLCGGICLEEISDITLLTDIVNMMMFINKHKKSYDMIYDKEHKTFSLKEKDSFPTQINLGGILIPISKNTKQKSSSLNINNKELKSDIIKVETSEEVVKTEVVKTEVVKTEVVKTDVVKTEVVKTDSDNIDNSKEVVKSEVTENISNDDSFNCEDDKNSNTMNYLKAAKKQIFNEKIIIKSESAVSLFSDKEYNNERLKPHSNNFDFPIKGIIKNKDNTSFEVIEANKYIFSLLDLGFGIFKIAYTLFISNKKDNSDEEMDVLDKEILNLHLKNKILINDEDKMVIKLPEFVSKKDIYHTHILKFVTQIISYDKDTDFYSKNTDMPIYITQTFISNFRKKIM